MTLSLLTDWSQDWMSRFPRRLTRKQKESFLAHLENELQARNFQTERAIHRFLGIPNRILLTKNPNPRVIFMAHYDTPTIMPPGISPIYTLFGHTRQAISSVFVFVLLIALFIPHFWLDALGWKLWADLYLLGIGILFLIPFFFPNPHNAEDNTSGVLALLALADRVKDQPFKDQIQFVFLDNEEWGLLGSQALKKHWQKNNHLKPDTILINLDCVARGNIPLVVYHKRDRLAREVIPFLHKHLPPAIPLDMKNTPLSDNFSFREYAAIDISLAEPSLIPGGFYIPKVHTPADRDFSAEKAARLVDGLAAFLQDKFTNLPSQEETINSKRSQ